MVLEGHTQSCTVDAQRLSARHDHQIQTGQFTSMLAETLAHQTLQTIAIDGSADLLPGERQTQAGLCIPGNHRQDGEIGIARALWPREYAFEI